MKNLTTTKPFAIYRVQRARLEAYNPEIIEEFDTAVEAEERLEHYADFDNAVQGHSVAHMTGSGLRDYYTDRQIEAMPTYA